MKKLALLAGITVLAFSFAACPRDPADPGNVTPPCNLPPRPSNPPGHLGEVPSLGYIWAGHFPLGNIIAYRHHRRHGDIAEVTGPSAIATTAELAYKRGHLLRRHFAFVTAEDEMKPSFINYRNQGQFNWTRVDNIVGFADEHGMRIHGHALAWHSQTPAWLFADGERSRRDEAIENLQTHIETVMMYFGDRVESWDVLNEVFQSWFGGAVNANNWRNFLRGNGEGASNWFSAIGSEPDGYCFIWIAFTTARRVADQIDRWAGRPVGTMILYYNDYNEEAPSKRNAIFYMVREMNDRFARENNGRRLIDAIGMQAHYHRGGVDGTVTESYQHVTNIDNVFASVRRFAELNVYVSITELDITVGNTGNTAGGTVNRPAGDPLTAAQTREQAITYASIFRFLRDFAVENPGRLRRVSFWGIDDPGSWRHRGSPHIWDGDLRPKEAFWAVADPDAFLANPDAFSRGTDMAAIRAAAVNIPAGAWD